MTNTVTKQLSKKKKNISKVGKAKSKNLKPKCVICENNQVTFIRDKLRYGLKRNVYKCDKCDFEFLWPRMGKEETVDFYKKKDYRNIPRHKLGLQSHNPEETFKSRMGQAHYRYDIVKPYLSKEKKLLEIGCASGSFVSLVQPEVDSVTGMELDPVFPDYVRARFGIPVIEKSIQELPKSLGKFDLITMWYVLEHLHDPVADLTKLREFISDDGHFFMLLPNLLDPLVSIYGVEEYKSFFYQLPHLNYFTPNNLQNVMEKTGWDAQVKPVQIYGLNNHLRWIFLKKPQAKQSKGSVDFFNIPDKIYRKLLSATQRTDSLLVIAKKA